MHFLKHCRLRILKERKQTQKGGGGIGKDLQSKRKKGRVKGERKEGRKEGRIKGEGGGEP